MFWKKNKSFFNRALESVKNYKDIGVISGYAALFFIVNIVLYFLINLWANGQETPFNPFLINPESLSPEESALVMQGLVRVILKFMVILASALIFTLLSWSYLKHIEWSYLTKRTRDKFHKIIPLVIFQSLIVILLGALIFTGIVLFGAGLLYIKIPAKIVTFTTTALTLALVFAGFHLFWTAYYNHVKKRKIFKPILESFKSFKHIKTLWKPYLLIIVSFKLIDLIISFTLGLFISDTFTFYVSLIYIIVFHSWAKIYMLQYFQELKI